MSNIENESTSVGRIDIQDYNINPEILDQKIKAKIKDILDRYGYVPTVTSFYLANGVPQCEWDIVKKPCPSY